MAPLLSGGTSTVRPVLLNSSTRKFLLYPSRAGSDWTVPRVFVRSGETCRSAALRYLERIPGLPCLTMSPLVGRHRVGRGLGLGSLEYVVLFRAADDVWDSTGQPWGQAARWWSLHELAQQHVVVEPASLPLFMDGYWDGWLPDGEISLD